MPCQQFKKYISDEPCSHLVGSMAISFDLSLYLQATRQHERRANDAKTLDFALSNSDSESHIKKNPIIVIELIIHTTIGAIVTRTFQYKINIELLKM